jgi:hypothetical protein
VGSILSTKLVAARNAGGSFETRGVATLVGKAAPGDDRPGKQQDAAENPSVDQDVAPMRAQHRKFTGANEVPAFFGAKELHCFTAVLKQPLSDSFEVVGISRFQAAEKSANPQTTSDTLERRNHEAPERGPDFNVHDPKCTVATREHRFKCVPAAII